MDDGLDERRGGALSLARSSETASRTVGGIRRRRASSTSRT